MTITLYTTPTCPYCKLVKEFFQEHRLNYTEVDVASNTSAAQQMVKKSGQMGVPVIEIDEKVIVGWNKAALEEALGLQGKMAHAA